MKKTLIFAAALILLLAACAPASSASQSQPSAEEIQAQVNEAVAMTVAAQNQVAESVQMTVQAQQALATATAIPTNTAETDPTPTLVIPTVTPVPTLPPSGGTGNTTTKPEYSCDVVHLRPFSYTEYNRGQKFDIKMTVVNNGTRSWPAGFDFKYVGGTQLTGTTIVELPAMAPGDQYQVVFDAVAPQEKGNHYMTWMVQGQYCYGYVAIVVK